MNRRRPQSYLFKSWLPLKQNGFSNKRVKLVSSPVLRMITVPQDITTCSPLWDTEHSYIGTDKPSFHRLNRNVTVSHFTVWQHRMEGIKARFWKVSVTVSRVQNNKYSVEIAYHHPDFEAGIAQTFQNTIDCSEGHGVFVDPTDGLRVAPDEYFFFKRFTSALSEEKSSTVFELIDNSADRQGDNLN